MAGLNVRVQPLRFPNGGSEVQKALRTEVAAEMGRCVVGPGRQGPTRDTVLCLGLHTGAMASQGHGRDETRAVYDGLGTVPGLRRGPSRLAVILIILIIKRRNLTQDNTSGLERPCSAISVLPQMPTQTVTATETANVYMALLV